LKEDIKARWRAEEEEKEKEKISIVKRLLYLNSCSFAFPLSRILLW
jgi:hypothetical protein